MPALLRRVTRSATSALAAVGLALPVVAAAPPMRVTAVVQTVPVAQSRADVRAAAFIPPPVPRPVDTRVSGPTHLRVDERRVTLTARPVSSTRVAVAVDTHGALPGQRVELRDTQGRTAASEVLTRSGRAVLAVAQPPVQRRSLTAVLAGTTLRKRVLASTERTYLRSSQWRVVNKGIPMPASDGPTRTTLVQGAAIAPGADTALRSMLAAARRAGAEVYPSNGFRSYAWQSSLFGSYVARSGERVAEAYSARPGHSEHQTGLALDAKNADGRCDLAQCFATTSGGRWLSAHAHQYGFVVRYRADNRAMTGYQPEPWHLRWVGPWLAGYLRETGAVSLEQVFELPAAATYRRAPAPTG